MTIQPSPDLLDLAEAVAAGTLRADDAERQLRLALGSERAAESEQALGELRGLIGAAAAVRAHARATREAFGSASPDLAATVAHTPASIATLVPGRVTGGVVRRRSSNGGDGAGRVPRRTWLLAAAALLLVGGAMAAGSGLVKLPSLVPPVPAPTLPVAVTNPTAKPSPSPTAAPSPAPTETPAVLPPRAASSTTTGSMGTPRREHSATLLPDGKVLVAGGSNGSDRLASAEQYDPRGGTWTPTESMANHAGIGYTSTLLLDGKVLVAGGHSDGKYLASALAELYDPNTGIWTATASMGAAREGHTATLLANGKVLVAGGYNNPEALASAELYDPGAGTWTATGSLGTARYSHSATLLRDSKVLVAGGGTPPMTSAGDALDSAELYDPGSGTWTATGTMVSRFSNQPAGTLLPNGTVLVAGDPPELYDPGTGSWTATGGPAMSWWYGPAVLLIDGRVLVLGAATPGQEAPTVTAAAVFDPVTASWTAAGRLSTLRNNYTATLLADGTVLVAGGWATPAPSGTAPGGLSSAELYDPGSR